MLRAFTRRFKRLPRLLVAVLLSFGALLGVSGLVVSARRAAPPAYTCLGFAPDILLDVTTGRDTVDRRPRPAPEPYQPLYVYSPGRRYRANLQMTSPAVYKLTIFPDQGEPFTLEEGMTSRISYVWAGSAARLAYYWMDRENRPFLGVAEFSTEGEHRLIRKVSYQTRDMPDTMLWSPDGAYLLYQDENRLDVLSVGTGRVRSLRFAGHYRKAAWGPASARLVYLHDDLIDSWVTVIDLDAPDERQYSYRIAGRINSADFNWSPDGERVVMEYFMNWPYFRIGAFGLDGKAAPTVAEVALRGDSISQPLTVWARGGELLIYLTRQSGGTATSDNTWNLMAYDIATGQHRPLVSNITKRPFYAPGSADQRLAITHPGSIAGKRDVSLMDADGTNRVTLVSNADDSGDPYWSPDGAYVAAVWAQGSGTGRRVYLTWARADGAGLTTRDAGFWDVRELRWLRGGGWPADLLAYVVMRGDAQGRPVFSVEALDLKTGAGRQIGGQYAEIEGIYQDGRTGTLAFWWRSPQGEIGFDGYLPDGARAFRYRAAAGIKSTIDGLVVHRDVIIVRQPGAPGAFSSPAGDRALLKLGPLNAESLHLAWAADDLPPRLLRENLFGLGDPLWSPDGRMFAVTEAAGRLQPITLSIFRADGRLIRVVDRRGALYGDLRWSTCE